MNIKLSDKKNKKQRRKSSAVVTEKGYVYINSTFNNTIVSITNDKHEVITWSSGGKEKFKGSKKSTPYAAQLAALSIAKEAYSKGMKVADAKIKGPGAGKEAALRGINSGGLKVGRLAERSSIPHNGCRKPRRRHV